MERIVCLEKSLLAAAVDLIRGDVEEELDLGRSLQRIEEDEGPVHIGQDELAGIQDGAVAVCLGGEMDDALYPRQNFSDDITVPDVAADELVACVVLHVLEVVEVPRISQLIQVDEADSRIFPE